MGLGWRLHQPRSHSKGLPVHLDQMLLASPKGLWKSIFHHAQGKNSLGSQKGTQGDHIGHPVVAQLHRQPVRGHLYHGYIRAVGAGANQGAVDHQRPALA